MHALDLSLLALGLSMDGVAVSAARGLAAPAVAPRAALRVGLLFGLFHIAMPLLGTLLGRQLGPVVQAWDHWIAFALLGGIGAKMLHEALTPDAPDADAPPDGGDGFGWRVLVLLAFATSVDAFAVGVTLPMLGAPILMAVAVIGVTAGSLSVVGLYAGRRFGALLGHRLDAVGGLVLLGLALKILLEHLLG